MWCTVGAKLDAMVVAAAVWFAFVVGLGGTLLLIVLIALIALGPDVVLVRRAVVLAVAIIVAEIAAVIGA